MSILSEAAQAAIDEENNEQIYQDLEADAQQLPPGSEAAAAKIDLSFFKTETGAGSIEDYIEHALNPHKSRGIAQMLRGFTGFAGSLNLAIIDIAFGFFEVLKEKNNNNVIVNHKQETGGAVNYDPIIKPQQ